MPIVHVAVDGNEANVSQKVGSNAYAYHLLVELEKLTAEREDLSVTVLLSQPPDKSLPPSRTGWEYKVFGPAAFWTQWALPLHLVWHKGDYDVLFTPGHYAPRLSPVPYISSVMDLAFLEFPKQFKQKDYLQLREWTRYSVKHASKVIAISQFTKKDVMKVYHRKASDVEVAYPGIDAKNLPIYKEKERVAVFKKWSLHHPFILYVGTLQPRKNLIRLIDAFEELFTQLQVEQDKKKMKYQSLAAYKLEDLQLVIAGKTGWLAGPIIDRITHSPLRKRIIVTGYVSEKEKAILYHESLCTVLIGLYEGFGMPPLEAMAQGSVPIVSNVTSLPEVVGEAGILVDPQNTTEIAQAIQQVLEMPAKERAKLLKKGRQRLKKFSWSNSAEVVLATIEAVARKKVSKT